MGRTPFRVAPRGLFVAVIAALFVLNTLGWVIYGRSAAPVHAAGVHAADSAAEARAPVTLRAALPSQDVQNTDRLTVVLDLGPDMEPEREPERAAVLESPFAVEPPLAGTWEWEGADRLVYLLERPIGACQTVRMTPTAALERYLGLAVDPEFEARWTSAPLRPTRLRTVGFTEEKVVAEVSLNAELAQSALLAALDVRVPDGEEPLVLTLLDAPAPSAPARGRGRGLGRGLGRRLARRSSAAESFRYRFEFPRPAREVQHVEVRLEHPWVYLGSEDGKHPAPHGWVLEVPRRFSLTDKEADVSSSTNSASITLRFSGSLDPSQPTPDITVRPRVEPLSVRIGGQRITLEGAFHAGESYAVTVPENLLAESGETLLDEARFEVIIPERRPYLSLPHWRGTLSPVGHLTLELKSTAVDAVRVTAERVLPNNLVEHVRGGSREFTSTEVLAETYPLPRGADASPVSRHALDLKGLLQDGDRPVAGIYHLRVEATEDRWTSDYATVRITDLGTTVKRDADGLHVWVRSIATGAPIEGAHLAALSVKDQTLGRGQTNAEGYGLIACPKRRESADTDPYLVLVEHDADMAYAELESSRWDIPRSVARGRKLPRIADVFTYTERSLYRPGDTVFITGVARTPEGVVFARPLALSVIRPDGAVMHEETVAPDPRQGLFHASFTTSENARTGTWKVVLRDSDSSESVGRASFGVEAFLPARMALTSASSLDPSGPSPAPTTAVTARSLAGTSLQDFGADVTTRWAPLTYRSSRFPLFTFQRAEDERHAQRASSEAELDEHGTARVETPGFASIAAAAPGLWRASSTWTVTEPGSRSAVSRSTVRVDTAVEHRGLRVDRAANLPADADASLSDAGAHVVQVGEPFAALAVCLDSGDAMVHSDGRALFVTLERIDRRWELDDGGHSSRWVRKETATTLAQEPMVPDASGVYRFQGTCARAGEYCLTLRGQDELPPMILSFHASDDPANFRPALENESVRLTVDSRSAIPGSKVALMIDSPFDGTALVTAEDDRLRWHRQVSVENGRATIDALIPDDVRGGLVLSCQVTRPLDARAQTWRPHRAYGWARVETVHSTQRLDVEIEAPARVRPGDVATVVVRSVDLSEAAAGRAAVHLWAVDEGLRIAGGHRRPRPFEHFMGPRAFHGSATDSWFTLLPDLELAGVVSRIGGDSGLAREARRRAPERVHVVPGVVWNEAVLLGKGGSARFELRVPDFTGELTWMAVVVEGDQYGSTEASTTLAGELPLALGLPRFVAPGDRFEVKVAFENATAETATVAPRIKLSEAAVIAEAAGAFEVTLAPGDAHVAWFLVEAVARGRITGEAWLEGTFESGRAAAERSVIDLPVRSGSPLVVASHTLSFDASEGLDGSLRLDELLGVDATLREACDLRLSASPGLDLLPAGAYLTDYPHGCAEQTASRIFASLSLYGLRSKDDDAGVALREVQDRVTRGFVRLSGMQTDDGGIGYWPGHSSSSGWASLYVAEVMAAAQELGFTPPPRLVEGLRQYVDSQLRAASSLDERAKLVFAAAALGSRHDGWMRRLEERRADLSGAARASLAAALGTVGEVERAVALLEAEPPSDGKSDGKEVQRGGRARDYLDSSIRTTALELRTLLAIDPHGAGVSRRVERLRAERSSTSGRWRNTIDNAAALAALAAYAQSLPAGEADWAVDIGAGMDAVTATSDGDWASQIPAGVDTLDFSVRGTGPVFVSVRAVGRAGHDAGELDRGLVCRRSVYDGAGNPLDPRGIDHGDLVFIEVELSTDGRSAVHDVAIVDPLPGGLEIEAPKLLHRFPWQESSGLREPARSAIRAGSADRVEFLDDRVLIYGTAAPEKVAFRYAARAVAAGTYQWSSVQAEAMYDPEVSSLGEATFAVEIAR